MGGRQEYPAQLKGYLTNWFKTIDGDGAHFISERFGADGAQQLAAFYVDCFLAPNDEHQRAVLEAANRVNSPSFPGEGEDWDWTLLDEAHKVWVDLVEREEHYGDVAPYFHPGLPPMKARERFFASGRFMSECAERGIGETFLDPLGTGDRVFNSPLVTMWIGHAERRMNCLCTIASDRLVVKDVRGATHQLLFRDIRSVRPRTGPMRREVELDAVTQKWEISATSRAEAVEIASWLQNAMSAGRPAAW